MGVYIKGMEMPKSCEECRLESFCSLWIDARRQYGDGKRTDIRHPDCPLVEVPTPHGRLIDADALMEKKNTHIDVLADWRYVRVSTIEDAPTVIESDDSLSCGIYDDSKQKSNNGACSADETSEKVQDE